MKKKYNPLSHIFLQKQNYVPALPEVEPMKNIDEI